MVDRAANGLRKLPLRVAGLLGVIASLVYVAGILGQEDTEFVPQALFWFAIMLVAGASAWYADRSQRYGHMLARGAAVAYFVLGLVSNVIFMIGFVLALVLAVAGFAGTTRTGNDQETGQ